MSMEDVDYFAVVVAPPATPARDAAVSVPVLGTPELCRYRPVYYPIVGSDTETNVEEVLDASDQMHQIRLPLSNWIRTLLGKTWIYRHDGAFSSAHVGSTVTYS